MVARQRPATAKAKKRQFVVVGAVIAAAIGFLVFKGVTSAFVYFETASQALQSRAKLGNSTFQIEGTVVPCTVHKVGFGNYDFKIASGKARVDIENYGDPPQLFKPDVAVVLVGHFVGTTDRFASNQILIKHSNQYVAEHPNRVKSGATSLSCTGGSTS